MFFFEKKNQKTFAKVAVARTKRQGSGIGGVIIAGVLLIAARGWAQPSAGHPAVIVHGPAAAAHEIIDTELAFERRSEQAGPAAAMRDFMDPADGLSFAGGEPARGAAAIFQAHGGGKPAGTLTWSPAEVFAAAAGDMGATWGHFRFTPPGKNPPITGRYVTVWRKQHGQWRGIIDIGTPD